MRIQHNIMAMSAYRNYNTNTSAVAKNLEKLSSGYKINRAGDDAAGLAISEKMRAQITGLNAAQKNVKDGISLVKTAEGAMQEIQDMLNRMDYLATQSANGTYQDAVDREALQKEVNQLKDEINRIADSANFNGIKLLDGSLDSSVSKTVGAPEFLNMGAMKNGYGNKMGGSWGIGGTQTAVLTNEPQYHKEATGEAKTSFVVGFNDLKFTADANGAAKFEFQLVNKDGSAALDFSDGTDGGGTDNSMTLTGKLAGEEYDAKDMAKAIYDKIGSTHKVELDYKGDGTVDDAKIEYEVTLNDDGTLTFTMSDDGYKAAVDLAKAQDDFAAGTAGATDPGVDRDPFEGNFLVNSRGNAGSARNFGTVDVNKGGPSAGKQLAQTYTTLDDIFVKNGNDYTISDGSGLKVGNEYYVFATTEDTAKGEFGDNVKVVDIRDLMQADGKTLKDADALNTAISRLTQVGKDNEMFTIEYSKDGETAIGLSEKETYKGDADLTKIEGFQEQIQAFKGIRSNVTTKEASGKALTLQIGDTSEEFNQLKVSVGDMHTAALGIADLDISNAESASKAIQTIKDAINNVSSVRGDLGAYQNRLEHTSNNLSVMAENITDAESSIRDTDIAEEMMSYTKNNILVQSAQAMLAQANQVPQGVLQLLG